jgi:RecG-like helicase
MRDLNIRGAGNLLGKQQHGFIDTVGFDLYSQMFAILNPEPNSVNSLIACNRSSAVSVSTLFAGCKNLRS